MDKASPSPTRSIVYTHIPRTAGSTVHTAFERAFGPAWYIMDSPGRLPGITEAIRESGADAVYVGGHFTLDDLDRAGIGFSRSPVIVATVREPIERVLSLYSLVVAAPQTNRPVRRAMGDDTSLESFLDAAAEAAPALIPPNAQCRVFSSEATFSAALHALGRYSFIATARRLSDLVRVMSLAAGLGKAVRLGRPLNAAPRLTASDSAIQRIRESTRDDARLFEYVDQQFDGLLRSPRP